MSFAIRTLTLMWQFIVSLTVALILTPIISNSIIGWIWLVFIVFYPIIAYIFYVKDNLGFWRK